MLMIYLTLIFISLTYDVSSKRHVVPIVFWHGMGDTCCDPLTLGFLMKLIKNKLNDDVYIYSIKIGQSFLQDMESGYFSDVNNQIKFVCQTLKNDTNLKKGYNAIGFSQGGQFLRGLAQRCPNPPMLNLISLGGPQQGVYGLPRCPGIRSLCDKIREILNTMVYDNYIQHHLVQSQYWHDPLNESLFKAKSTFLADINQEKIFNPQYKENLLKLNKFVLVKFTKDTIVIPLESEWFGFFKEKSTSQIVTMEESELYKKDLLGLRQMKETGKLILIEYPDDHLRFDIRWFEKVIISEYLNVTQSMNLPANQLMNLNFNRKFSNFTSSITDNIIVDIYNSSSISPLLRGRSFHLKLPNLLSGFNHENLHHFTYISYAFFTTFLILLCLLFRSSFKFFT